MPLNLRPKGRGGPRGISLEQMAEALTKNAGNVSLAAAALGIANGSVYERLNNHPELAAIKARAKARVTDMAEARVMKRIERDDWNGINLWLTTQAGWTRRTEVTGENGAPLTAAAPVHIHVSYVNGAPGPATEEDEVL